MMKTHLGYSNWVLKLLFLPAFVFFRQEQCIQTVLKTVLNQTYQVKSTTFIVIFSISITLGANFISLKLYYFYVFRHMFDSNVKWSIYFRSRTLISWLGKHYVAFGAIYVFKLKIRSKCQMDGIAFSNFMCMNTNIVNYFPT